MRLSYYDSTRATGAPDGYAYAAGGHRATEAEIGVMKGGTLKHDASQRFVDSPAGYALRRERSSAGLGSSAARSLIDDDKKAVVRDRVPAKLLAPYDGSTLPALPAGATEPMVTTRGVLVANYTADNARKPAHGVARHEEVKAGLGDDLASRADMLCGALVLLTLLGAVAIALCYLTMTELLVADGATHRLAFWYLTPAVYMADVLGRAGTSILIGAGLSALADYSLGAAVAVAWRGITAIGAGFHCFLGAAVAVAWRGITAIGADLHCFLGAAVAAAWRGITAMARLTVRLTARAPVGRVVRCLTYVLIAFGIFAHVQSVLRAGASEPPRSAALAARRLIEVIEEPDGVAAQAFEAQLKTLHDTLYVDGSLEGGRGSFISCCEADEIAQTFNVSIKGGGDALP